MLVNTYAHIQQSSRVELGKKFESGFYAKPEAPSPQAVPAAGEPTISMTALLELLKNADPKVKAQLRLALLTDAKFTTHFKAITAYAGNSHEKADRAKTVH